MGGVRDPADGCACDGHRVPHSVRAGRDQGRAGVPGPGDASVIASATLADEGRPAPSCVSGWLIVESGYFGAFFWTCGGFQVPSRAAGPGA